jgi:pimeloyl-ACP methyl ester carboxylesterase
VLLRKNNGDMMKELNWIVVQGGPGVSKKYLENLNDVFVNFNLYFYDQMGSPELPNDSTSINDLVDQIKAFATEKELERFGIISHSFGNYITMRFLEKYGESDLVTNLIMLSPCPFIHDEWRRALALIAESIPTVEKENINSLAADLESDGVCLFKALYPFYSGNSSSTLDLDVEFNLQACNEISGLVQEYDDRALLSKLSIPAVRVVGEKDHFYAVEEEKDLVNTIVLKDLGHYVNLENIEQLIKAVEDIERGLEQCQKTIKKSI